MFYSKSKNTWFDSAFKADYEASGIWPADAKEYSRDVFDETVSNRPADKIMVPDSNGDPSLADPPGPSMAELCALIDTAADAARRAVAGDQLH